MVVKLVLLPVLVAVAAIINTATAGCNESISNTAFGYELITAALDEVNLNLQLHSQELSSTNEKLEKTVQGIETYGINKHSIMQQNNFLSQRHSIESLEKTIQEILALVTKQNFIVQENNLHCQKLNSNIESLEKTTQGILTLVTKQSSIMQENNFRSQELNSNLNNLEKTVQEIETHVIKQVWKVNSLEENVIKILQSVEKTLPETCADISDCQSGVYHIQPRTRCPYTFEVFCDQEYEGGGWLVIHNRYDGSVGFYRDWEEYEAGFGDLHGEFWLGLKKIHELTYAKPHELHIILEDIDGKVVTAHYDRFVVGGPETKYVLKSLGTYTGTAGDSLSIHAGMKFTTIDNDNDGWLQGNCAKYHGGSWWYNNCGRSNLNGLYEKEPEKVNSFWYSFRGWTRLKQSRMMIKVVNHVYNRNTNIWKNLFNP